MKYIVVETKLGDNDSIQTSARAFQNKELADKEFYSALIDATDSSFAKHSVTLLDENGLISKVKSYNHTESTEE